MEPESARNMKGSMIMMSILNIGDVGMVNHKPKSYADIGRTWGRTVGKN